MIGNIILTNGHNLTLFPYYTFCLVKAFPIFDNSSAGMDGAYWNKGWGILEQWMGHTGTRDGAYWNKGWGILEQGNYNYPDLN